MIIIQAPVVNLVMRITNHTTAVVTMPIKLMIVGFGALALIARIQLSEDARKLLLIGWVLAFYWALSIWDTENRARVFREEVQHEPEPQALVVEEFYDSDRFTLQEAAHETEADDHMEMV